MPEKQTRGWHTRSAERAGRVLEKCRRRRAASVSDVEDLRNVATRMATEIDRLHGVIRAKAERLQAAAEMPAWVRETTHVVIEQRGGRVITASGLDLQDWWRNGRIGEVFDDNAAEPCHVTDVGLFHLHLTYVDEAGAYWEHRGDWQYDEPLMWRVEEPGGTTMSVPEFLADVLARGPLTPAPRPVPAAEATA
ncbi:hypothetical protein [Embleya sp. NPDC005971]|uniref:hypothetical protein n=1 Tax=Embleya sp. NPDC005971 TaxID=3156724 RepID=UPI0033DC9100